MTTINEARQAIYARFISQWGTQTEFTFDNEPFTEPVSDPWVRLAVRNTDGGQETLGQSGNRRYTRDASIFVQVFTLIDTGTQEADTLARIARNIFEGERFSGVFANDGTIREIGPDGKWYQTNVEIAFFYDEIK